jgi:hypothetical protein
MYVLIDGMFDEMKLSCHLVRFGFDAITNPRVHAVSTLVTL